MLKIYSVEQSPATNHSFTVGYMRDAQSAISKQTNNASEQLSKCKSVNSSDVSQQTTGSYRLWFVVFSRQRFFKQVYTDQYTQQKILDLKRIQSIHFFYRAQSIRIPDAIRVVSTPDSSSCA